MQAIATYVFFDLETTNLPDDGIVYITELAMLAVKRQHLLNMEPDEEPRVQNRIQMCFNPPKTINNESAMLSGLNNRDLKNEAEFDNDTFILINTFINTLEKPVCLVAHNAFAFHFPILKYHFKCMNVALSDDIMCTDSLYAFYDIMEFENDEDPYSYEVEAKRACKKIKPKSFSKLWRDIFFKDTYPSQSYKLNDIYRRVQIGPYVQTNRAMNQCYMIMKSAIPRIGEFVDWVHENHCAFSEVHTIKM